MKVHFTFLFKLTHPISTANQLHQLQIYTFKILLLFTITFLLRNPLCWKHISSQVYILLGCIVGFPAVLRSIFPSYVGIQHWTNIIGQCVSGAVVNLSLEMAVTCQSTWFEVQLHFCFQLSLSVFLGWWLLSPFREQTIGWQFCFC